MEKTTTECTHCGDVCVKKVYAFDKVFCCEGCKTVYSILEENDLTEYYEITDNPGFTIEKKNNDKYGYLLNESIAEKLPEFKEEEFAKVLFNIPNIHCSSCIWLLENMGKIHEGVLSVTVNFVKKEIAVNYNPKAISLYELVILLDDLGYGPEINWDSQNKKTAKNNNSLAIKLGVAAFAFGNIMLLSFPEYLGISTEIDHGYKSVFSMISFGLSFPVVFFCASDYFISAYKGLKRRFVTIDVPISLGIITLFIQSSYEIYHSFNPGYLDSLSGLVFFLLIGKWFQSKTYENLSFERDYKSYFPLAVTKLINGEKVSIPVKDIHPGDTIIIKNEEIIPADSILLSDETEIDYSFVTGESNSVNKVSGDTLYAGGRQQGSEIKLKVLKETSQSYLTGLWNKDNSESGNYRSKKIVDTVSQYFTVIIISIALISGIAWFFIDVSMVWSVVAAILIVACPCALALSVPFTYGSTVRLFGRNSLYLKASEVVEKFPEITTVVLDKTGTITLTDKGNVAFIGEELNREESEAFFLLLSGSAHPLSKKASSYFSITSIKYQLKDFEEIPGKGLSGSYNGKIYKAGSPNFTNAPKKLTDGKTVVSLSVDNNFKGYFLIETRYIDGLDTLLSELSKDFKVDLVSGDNNTEEDKLKKLFQSDSELIFNAKPGDKLEHIKRLQKQGHKVLMIGDGLNDGVALKESYLGIAVTGEKASFSPASDAIISIDKVSKLKKFFKLGNIARKVLIGSFLLSFTYNLVGLGFAVTGHLSPVIAAILMPISSITVVAFTTLSIKFFGTKLNLN